MSPTMARVSLARSLAPSRKVVYSPRRPGTSCSADMAVWPAVAASSEASALLRDSSTAVAASSSPELFNSPTFGLSLSFDKLPVASLTSFEVLVLKACALLNSSDAAAKSRLSCRKALSTSSITCEALSTPGPTRAIKASTPCTASSAFCLRSNASRMRWSMSAPASPSKSLFKMASTREISPALKNTRVRPSWYASAGTSNAHMLAAMSTSSGWPANKACVSLGSPFNADCSSL
mmetsp:Transcript_82030/g.163878  ORF Transcript_82030/g.163878 Transcript_82030/m.163878 type:complete len:235 (+) Transcript_82030:451-1155(+)